MTAVFNSPNFGDASSIEGGIGLSVWNCDRSSRQAWKFSLGRHLSLNDGSNEPLCIAGENSDVSSSAYLVNCTYTYTTGAGVYSFIGNHLVAENGLCLTTSIISMADMPAGGAPVMLAPCQGLLHQSWDYDADTHEIRSWVDQRCITAGWPFVQSVAARTPTGKTVVVVVNEADEEVALSIRDTDDHVVVSVDIPERSIQTYIY